MFNIFYIYNITESIRKDTHNSRKQAPRQEKRASVQVEGRCGLCRKCNYVQNIVNKFFYS